MVDSGFIFSTDDRDADYIFHKGGDTPPIRQKLWWNDGWWGHQGNTPHCCAYAWLHFMDDGPVLQTKLTKKVSSIVKPVEFYNECKKIDGLKGSGTTLHAGAAVAKRLGFISEYKWATTLDDLVYAVLVHGPVVAGTHWYTGMEAGTDGRMKASGKAAGGHAFLINGVDMDKRQFRIKNSYGKEWGKNGDGWLSFTDMERLMKGGGAFCIPFEVELEIDPTI